MLISKDARRKGSMLGLSVPELKEIASIASKITHRVYTHSAEHWLLKIKEGSVLKIALVRCDRCTDEKRVQVFNECPNCHGNGCKQCRGFGDVEGTIPCPECN